MQRRCRSLWIATALLVPRDDERFNRTRYNPPGCRRAGLIKKIDGISSIYSVCAANWERSTVEFARSPKAGGEQ
jgi:hypothetical protein